MARDLFEAGSALSPLAVVTFTSTDSDPFAADFCHWVQTSRSSASSLERSAWASAPAIGVNRPGIPGDPKP